MIEVTQMSYELKLSYSPGACPNILSCDSINVGYTNQ